MPGQSHAAKVGEANHLRRAFVRVAAALATVAACLVPAVLTPNAALCQEPARAASPGAVSDISSPVVPPASSVAQLIQQQVGSDTAPPGVSPDTWSRVVAAYTAVSYAPLWLSGNTFSARVDALLAVLSHAREQGLDSSRYQTPQLAAALDTARSGADTGAAAHARVARADVLLTSALADYASDMLTGVIDPHSVESAWHIDPSATDVDSAIAHTLNSGDFSAALHALEPEADGYATLKRSLARYREIAARGNWGAIPNGASIHPGDSSSRTAALERRLAAEGFVQYAAAINVNPLDSLRYTGAVAGVLARFQHQHGLAEDSVVGPRTLAALNVPAQRRAEQIAANMERYRWLPHDLGERYVVVNVPAFRLDAFDGGSRHLSMRVVVGSELADRHTPIFSDSMSYVQFGPYWKVPESIAHREIIPKARRSRSYLTRNHFQVVRGWGDNARVVNPYHLSNAALASDRYHFRQEPGPDNALGRVKFIFPNDFNVYLHDTPATSLFDQQTRAYSHGCVRVADPAALARFVLSNQPQWTPERINTTLANGDRVKVDLQRKIPVYIIYLTAFDSAGHVAFRDDLYELDEPLIQALTARLGSVTRPGATVPASS